MNRLAHALADRGVGPGDKVGIYGYNGNEWVEAQWAAWKLRAVPVNVNYRYVEGELRYLFDNADVVALVHGAEFSARIAAVRDELPEAAWPASRTTTARASTSRCAMPSTTRRRSPAASPERDFGPRSRRRPLHPLHRRHHRHAEGRDVAPGGLLQGHDRPDHDR